MTGRRPDEGGFTLPELLVTITLLTVLSGAIIGSVVAVQRNLGVANATMNDLQANRIALERITTLLRGAVAADGQLDRTTVAVTTTQTDRVRFHSVTGQDPTENPVLVELAVEDGELVERIWNPVPLLQTALTPGALPTYDVAPTRQRVIARDLVDARVFAYWTHADDGTTATSRCGRRLTPTTSAEQALVDAVSVRLRLQEPTGYDSAPSDLQGWARFASGADLGFSTTASSAGCLDGADGGFGFDASPVAP